MRAQLAGIILISTVVVVTACGVQRMSDSDSKKRKPSSQPAEPTAVVSEQDASTTDQAQVTMVQAARRKAPAPEDRTEAQYKRALTAASSSAPAVSGSYLRRGYPQPAHNVAENYQIYDQNSVKRTAEEPLSTFSIDVDTGAYSNMRRYLNLGQIPPEDAVRVEELINYFSYDYPVPQSTETPFSIYTEMAPSPWNAGKHLLHIGLQGYDLDRNSLPAANLVFLIDVSGSMQSANKLGLVKSSLKLLTKQLSGNDSIAIVTYAGSAGTVLEPVAGSEKRKIYEALDRLSARGSTWGEGGILAAYELARASFIENGINRVVLATDGDFNVGIDSVQELTLNTIASDVKIQIEFNPAVVSEYRLIGYENRLLKREDFNNDKVDAGDIGAGHSVTALYEIALKDSGGQAVDPLRYKREVTVADRDTDAEIAFLKLRYKNPGETDSQLVSKALLRTDILPSIDSSSIDFRFAASVSGFGQLLRGSDYLSDWDYTQVIALAKAGRGSDRNGYRAEFVKLVELADALVLPIAKVSE
jgi:Ca-activated chloride channel family protein